MVSRNDVPSWTELINPTLDALHRLGGSASNQELEDEIVSSLQLAEKVADLLHGQGSLTEVGYRAAWARNCLKHAGLVENSERGVWALTPEGARTERVDSRELVREVQRQLRAARQPDEPDSAEPEGEEPSWQERLLGVLREMDPIAFERLCQRLLRESGFIEVDVTKRSGDGGIDGHGTMRLGGLISFNVLFQSKRYQGNIGPDTVRDFRGAMVGRADKGLLITTGGFTREARREATRDGAPPIDLIDGELLVEKLKELRIGVKVRPVEVVEIQTDWFTTV
jgi:restriction system protein